MDRRYFSLYAIAFAFRPTAVAQEGGAPAGELLAALYASILRGRCKCCNARENTWFVDSRTYAPELPQLVSPNLTWPERARQIGMHPYLAPPQEHIEEAKLLLSNLEAQLASGMRIPRELSTNPHYRLISEREQEFYWKLKVGGGVYDPHREAEARAIPARYHREFAHAAGLVQFSPIGFNPQRNLALCSYRVSDGCTEESWCVLQHSASGWRQLNWAASTTEECA